MYLPACIAIPVLQYYNILQIDFAGHAPMGTCAYKNIVMHPNTGIEYTCIRTCTCTFLSVQYVYSSTYTCACSSVYSCTCKVEYCTIWDVFEHVYGLGIEFGVAILILELNPVRLRKVLSNRRRDKFSAPRTPTSCSRAVPYSSPSFTIFLFVFSTLTDGHAICNVPSTTSCVTAGPSSCLPPRQSYRYWYGKHK